ncbi:MAG: hypothetical protein KDD46_07915 [Bdellovibrionales bacterium]|nr:hypothetical protein [Bdellovibrionales bacterium]
MYKIALFIILAGMGFVPTAGYADQMIDLEHIRIESNHTNFLNKYTTSEDPGPIIPLVLEEYEWLYQNLNSGSRDKIGKPTLIIHGQEEGRSFSADVTVKLSNGVSFTFHDFSLVPEDSEKHGTMLQEADWYFAYKRVGRFLLLVVDISKTIDTHKKLNEEYNRFRNHIHEYNQQIAMTDETQEIKTELAKLEKQFPKIIDPNYSNSQSILMGSKFELFLEMWRSFESILQKHDLEDHYMSTVAFYSDEVDS